MAAPTRGVSSPVALNLGIEMSTLKPATSATVETPTAAVAARVLAAEPAAPVPHLDDHSCRPIQDPLTGTEERVVRARRKTVTFSLPEEGAGRAAEASLPAGDTEIPVDSEVSTDRPRLDSSSLGVVKGGILSPLHSYLKLGAYKYKEDVYIQTRMNPPGAAYGYLQRILSSSEPLNVQNYLEVQTLLSGDGATFRTEPSDTLVETLYVPLGYGDAHPGLRMINASRLAVGVFSGLNCYRKGMSYVYKLTHSNDSVSEKLEAIIRDFNKQILAGFNKQDKFLAIATFFHSCELLQPIAHTAGVSSEIPSSRRVNLALLNYLLAKHGFPCVIFKGQLEFITGQLFSKIDIINFDSFLIQIKQAMRHWCDLADVPFEEF